jgi:hypothetical protein
VTVIGVAGPVRHLRPGDPSGRIGRLPTLPDQPFGNPDIGRLGGLVQQLTGRARHNRGLGAKCAAIDWPKRSYLHTNPQPMPTITC